MMRCQKVVAARATSTNSRRPPLVTQAPTLRTVRWTRPKSQPVPVVPSISPRMMETRLKESIESSKARKNLQKSSETVNNLKLAAKTPKNLFAANNQFAHFATRSTNASRFLLISSSRANLSTNIPRRSATRSLNKSSTVSSNFVVGNDKTFSASKTSPI